jgi:hypothetical protein
LIRMAKQNKTCRWAITVLAAEERRKVGRTTLVATWSLGCDSPTKPTRYKRKSAERTEKGRIVHCHSPFNQGEVDTRELQR